MVEAPVAQHKPALRPTHSGPFAHESTLWSSEPSRTSVSGVEQEDVGGVDARRAMLLAMQKPELESRRTRQTQRN